VPVTTVNIDKLAIKIIRVGDRLLSQIETGTVDNTTLYGWDAKQLQDNQGALVWQGSMAVDNVKNDSVVTLIPIHDLLKGKKPGAYVVVAQDAAKKPANDEDNSGQLAMQWVVDSDIALTTFTSANAATGSGLTVFCPLLQPRHAAGGSEADAYRPQQQRAGIRHHRWQWPRRFRRRPVRGRGRRRADHGDGLWP